MPDELAQDLGDRLRKSLSYSGISVGQMAETLEVHRNTISGYIANRAKPMKLVLRIWAEHTRVPVQWLADGTWPDGQPK